MTPVVEVNIGYSDPPRGQEVHETFTFIDASQQQKFRLRVDEAAPKTYQVEIVYYLADGQIVTRPTVTSNKSQLTIPKYVEAA